MLRLDSDPPAHWCWRCLGEIAEINPSSPRLNADDSVSFIGMADVSESGTVTGGDVRRYANVRNGFSSFKDGDVLVAKITPCFENGKGAHVQNLVNGAGFGSTEFHVLRAKELVCSEFLFLHTRTSPFRKRGEVNMTGSAGQKRVPRDFINDWQIPLPPLDEQRRIVEIWKTWDHAIRTAENIREGVDQLYKGVAAQQIRFRGDNVHKLSELLLPNSMQEIVPSGAFRALGVRSHGKGTFQRTDDLDAAGSSKTVYRVEPNRFIVNIVFAWEGAAAITTANDAGCLVSHRFPTFTVNENLLHLEYFRHMIRTKSFWKILALASPGGAGRNRTLNRKELLRFSIHVPPFEQQKRIGKALKSLDRQLSLWDRYLECLIPQRETLVDSLIKGQRSVRDLSWPVAVGVGS